MIVFTQELQMFCSEHSLITATKEDAALIHTVQFLARIGDASKRSPRMGGVRYLDLVFFEAQVR